MTRYLWYEINGFLCEAVGPFADGPALAEGVTLSVACDRVSPGWVKVIPARLGRRLLPAGLRSCRD